MLGVLRANDERVARPGDERRHLAGATSWSAPRRGSRDRSRGASRPAPRRCDTAWARARCRGAGGSRRRRIRIPTARTRGSVESRMSHAPPSVGTYAQLWPPKMRRRLGRRDDAPGELLVLDELQDAAPCRVDTSIGTCAGGPPLTPSPVLDVTRRRIVTSVSSSEATICAARAADDAAPSQPLTRMCSFAHVATGKSSVAEGTKLAAPPNGYMAASAHRHVRLQMERRADSGARRRAVVERRQGRPAGQATCWSPRRRTEGSGSRSETNRITLSPGRDRPGVRESAPRCPDSCGTSTSRRRGLCLRARARPRAGWVEVLTMNAA